MKNYVKPELFFESYELSQNIAACGWDLGQKADGSMTFNSPKSCVATGDPAYGNPGLVVFVEGNDKCVNILESYCYENSADNIGMKIFQS